MTDAPAKKDHLLEQIAEQQQHYVEVMNERLPETGERELELYLGILGKLTAKLEERDKPLRTCAQELFAEVAGLMMKELGR